MGHSLKSLVTYDPPWFRWIQESTGDPIVNDYVLPFSFVTVPREPATPVDGTFVDVAVPYADLLLWRDGFNIAFGCGFSFDGSLLSPNVPHGDSDRWYIAGGPLSGSVSWEINGGIARVLHFLPLAQFGYLELNPSFTTVSAFPSFGTPIIFDEHNNGTADISLGVSLTFALGYVRLRLCRKADLSGYRISCLMGGDVSVGGGPAGLTDAVPFYIYLGEWSDAKPVFSAGTTDPDAYAAANASRTLEAEETIGTFFGVDVKWRRFSYHHTFTSPNSGFGDTRLSSPSFSVSPA